MKNKRLLAGPYLFWSVSFVVIPLLVIVYYAFTTDEGGFTFANLAQITTPENLKALGISVLLSLISTLVCLVMAYPLAMILSDKLYCIDFYSAHVDEFSFKDNGLADPSGKERCHKQYSEPFSSAGSGDHQYSLCHCSWNGV